MSFERANSPYTVFGSKQCMVSGQRLHSSFEAIDFPGCGSVVPILLLGFYGNSIWSPYLVSERLLLRLESRGTKQFLGVPTVTVR